MTTNATETPADATASPNAVPGNASPDELLPEILTLRETARYLRCSERHIQNLLTRGLPYFRLGSLLRFRREDVLAHLANTPARKRHRQRAQAKEKLV